MAFKDEAGITRHALTTNQLEELRQKLEELSQKLDNFIADLTRAEFMSNVKALTDVNSSKTKRKKYN